MRKFFSSFHFNKEYFLFLLPLFFVFHGYTENFPLVSVTDVAELFILYLLAIIIISFIGLIFFRSWRKAAIFTMLIMCFNFFFGSLHDASKNIFGTIIFNRYSFILPAVGIGIILLIIFFKRNKRSFNKLTRFSNILFAVLIVVDVVLLSIKIFENNNNQQPALPSELVACDTCATPDIYLIMADEYAGQEELTELFGYDNSSFENELKTRGFYVVEKPRSNYNYTFYSVASLFNLNYIQNLEGKSFSRQDRNISYNIINKNTFINFLKKHGYEIYNYSLFKLDDKAVKSESYFFKTGKDMITAQTFIHRIKTDIGLTFMTKFRPKAEMEEMADKQLNNISILYNGALEVAAKKQQAPKFVYTHLMMPHYPYYFDSVGNRLPAYKILDGHQHDKNDYIAYLKYSNKKFIQLIDNILKNSLQPPVILFMSDHGFRYYGNKKQEYQFMNFNAVYFPNKNYDLFYPGMSNINQFRVLLNTQFNQQLPLLKDSLIFFYE